MRKLALKNYELLNLYAAPSEKNSTKEYESFEQINGSHPWQKKVPQGYISYQVRVIRKAKVRFFNFRLAKEMGLIPQDHSEVLNPKLEKKIIETFSLQIINEYDLMEGTKFPAKDIKPNKYMATRYLQLQHSNKMGTTSGDGRSIWNGSFTGNKSIWDISSCGTGSTRLSPAYAALGRPIRTGDPNVSYGCGQADIDEGLSAAILSESFHARGISTERTLAIIETHRGNALNVRAQKNLLRPAHVFLHLKQGNQLALKAAMDHYIDRQIQNHEWSGPVSSPHRYDHFLEQISIDYAKFCAKLEDEYIFCWLDWDGDNMLMNGGIIDYGSIRQFGLFHHHYRYDDVERYSTNIREQKNKARYLVQTFAQLIDFLKNGKKREIGTYRYSKCLKNFDQAFSDHKLDLFLRRLGINSRQAEKLKTENRKLLEVFHQSYSYFECKETNGSFRKTPDGINWPASYDAKNLLRELPKAYLKEEKILSGESFLQLLRSKYSTKQCLRLTSSKEKKIMRFQELYLAVMKKACAEKTTLKKILLEAVMRAGNANKANFVTGDGIIYVVDSLVKKRKHFQKNEFLLAVQCFIASQCGEPWPKKKLSPQVKKLLKDFEKMLQETAHTI